MNSNKANLIKTIIIFSLVVIFSGVAFDFESNKKLINPKLDTYVVTTKKTKDGSISITKVNNIDKESKLNKNNINKTNKNQITNNNALDSNNNLRNSIQSKYGISIKYGQETDGYKAGSTSITSLTDPNEIQMALRDLDTNLSYYPKNFFSEQKNNGYNLTIYLIKKYSIENVTGITDSKGRNVIISLSTEFQFVESIHHELYHYVEGYMRIKGIKYTTWDSLNPTNFNYGNKNTSLAYNYTKSPDAYFVNDYAQTSQEEDRASTFEYMMATTKADCLNNGKPIWLKAKYMCEQIDLALDSVNSHTIEHWERYIYQ